MALGVLVADQVTKVGAVASLEDGPARIVGDFARLELSRNSGGAFSILPWATPMLTAIAVGAAFMIVRVAARVGDRATLLAFGGILGGTLGNLVDRVVRDPGFPSGRVVDFVRVGGWPTFNLADAAITIGVAVFLVRAWRA